MSAALAFCERERPWLVETIRALVGLESPSLDKAAVDRCGDELARRLDAIGGRVQRIRQIGRGDHIRAEFGSGGRQVLVLGHFDTVWPVGELERMPLEERDGRLHGPGVFDMKSGIAVGMLAMRAIQELALLAGLRVVLLLTSDEEVGSGTSRELIEREARESCAVLVLEPSLPDGAAKTTRKGCGEYELAVHGIPAHAGLDPGKGASAIVELAYQIQAITSLQDLSRGISTNVGIIEGGSRPNVVAPYARAVIDVRVPRRADAQEIDTALRSLKPTLAGTRLELTGGIDRPPMERTAAGARLFGLGREVAASLGRDLQEGSAGGGSDGNFTAAVGVPTLDGLGPSGDGAHARHEHVLLSDLTWRAALVAGLIARLQ